MSKTFSLRSMLVPSKGRSETLRNGGVVIGGVTSIGTPQENASTVIDKINNTTVVLNGDYSKIQRISITDLLNLTQDEIGANDLYIVYAGGSDESGWSEESFIYEEETCPAASFFQWINGKWEHITDEIDLSKTLKYDSLPKETYMIMSLNGQTSFPNIYGRNRAGLPIAVLGKYQLDEKGLYKPIFETTGTPSGGTSSNYTWTITVPYARYYIQGGNPIYEGGLLSASDYKRLIENTGVNIDTVVPDNPSDTHVPSTKLMADNFKIVNLWLNSLSDMKADRTELSNYFDNTYILANYYDKNSVDNALSEVQKKDTLAKDVEALGFTKNAGTITGVNLNGENVGRSGVVDIKAMPLGGYYSASNNGTTQPGKWCEIAFCYINPNSVISKTQIFSVTRPTGLYDKMQGLINVSIRVSHGTVSHLYLFTDNIYLKNHFKVVYDKSKDRCSLYVTANEAWETWRLTAISYPVQFSQGVAQIVDEPIDPTGGMLVDAQCYNVETYNKTDIGPIYYEDVTNREKAVNVNAIAFWNGAYNYQNSSNLAYCRHGAFGTIVTKNVNDYEAKKPLWAAYTQDSGAGSYITFLRMKGVTANMVANLEYQFSIRLLGRHNSFGGDCTIRVKGTVVSSSSLGDPRMWYVSGEASHPAIRMYKISDSVYEIAVLKTNRYAYAVAKLEDLYAATECVTLEMITNGTSHGTSDNYHVQALLYQSDWNETDQNSIGYIKNKPAAVTEETVSGWGFVKRKFVRRTITYSNGAYGGAILDSRGVDKCTAYNGRSLSVTITGLTTQQEYQDFLLQNTISVSYTYFEDGVATRSDGIISKISAGTAINIQLKQDMLHLTDALVYVSVVFDKII